jgi:drug/metabolite transporter (DMT)-like permease
MAYIALAVAFSVIVSVLLKLAKRADIDLVQAVAANYVVASLMAWWLLHATPQAAMAAPATWAPVGLLGVILPSIFVVLGYSVRTAGIARTDVAQRLSLFVSVFAAFAFMGDVLTLQKGVGIALGLVAILCVLARPQRETRAATWAPLAVFAGFGIIDICFKLVARSGASFAGALLAAFLIALVLTWIAVAWRAMRGRAITARSMGFGMLLGACNFANILFYVKGHMARPDAPSLVFASMNLGVVVVGALVGALVFRERLSRANWLGIAVAVAAIITMARA